MSNYYAAQSTVSTARESFTLLYNLQHSEPLSDFQLEQLDINLNMFEQGLHGLTEVNYFSVRIY